MIKLHKLYKSFDGKPILHNIQLNIPEGQIVAIVGPSGSGKSTLLRCMNGLEIPDQGEVYIDGEKLTSKTASSLCQKIGMVFQLFHLFPHLSLLNNITYAPQKLLKKTPKIAKAEALKLLEQVGLKSQGHKMPHQLSGGQKQRGAIARALAMHPKAILFDEPTSALDPEMVKEVLNTITNLTATGLTVVIATHEMSFAEKLANRILFIDHGKILEDTTPSIFFKNPTHPRAKQFLDNVL